MAEDKDIYAWHRDVPADPHVAWLMEQTYKAGLDQKSVKLKARLIFDPKHHPFVRIEVEGSK